MDAEYHKIYSREHYRKNKARYLEKARRWNDQQRAQLRRLVNRYKVFKGCAYCGYRKHPVALDLHHTRDKDKAVGNMISAVCSIKKLRVEIRKCQVLCANCHRIEHHNPESS